MRTRTIKIAAVLALCPPAVAQEPRAQNAESEAAARPARCVFDLNGTSAWYGAGNVGIGTNQPSAPLDVSGSWDQPGGAPRPTVSLRGSKPTLMWQDFYGGIPNTFAQSWILQEGGSGEGDLEFSSRTQNGIDTAVNVLAPGARAAASSGDSGFLSVLKLSKSGGITVTCRANTAIAATSAAGIAVDGVRLDDAGVLPALKGVSYSRSESATAIYGELVTSGPGASSAAVKGVNNGNGGSGIGVWGQQNGSGYGVYGTAPSGRGVKGVSDTGTGVEGVVSGSGGETNGVLGVSKDGRGVRGQSGYIGVSGEGDHSGVYGRSPQYGVFGTTPDPRAGKGLAGNFIGNVAVSGNLSKSAGSFKIDHPLDPANKYLSHSFVESPDMMNIYNGNVTLDGTGAAEVTLPVWFDALNGDFRYQLTAVGAPGPDLHIAREIAGGRFRIAGGPAGLKVSWQVTGVRKDAYAAAHRIPVEEVKPDVERGRYLHPELYGASEDLQIGRIDFRPTPPPAAPLTSSR